MLIQVVDEFRAMPEDDLNSPDGIRSHESCCNLVETLHASALERKDEQGEQDATRAIYLAGRLPDLGDSTSLQDKLRVSWNKFRLDISLENAAALIPSARHEKEALDSLMEALDLSEFHARLAVCGIEGKVAEIMAELQPHVYARLQALIDEGRLDEVEENLNSIGAGRREALELQRVQARLGCLRGLSFLRSSLAPFPGQVGFPVLKQRQLRHAVLNLRTALNDDAAGDLAAPLREVMYNELLPQCIEHSTGSALAVLQTAFDLKLNEAELWGMAQEPYDKLEMSRKVELLKEMAALCHRCGSAPPDWLLTPAQMECQQAIRAALGGGEADMLQSALVQVKETEGGREICAQEFDQALQLLRREHRLPAGWDVESMLAGAHQKKLLSKVELTDPQILRAFDQLLKRTANPVWTRDRRGPVTRGFEAVRAVQVMNASTWSQYVERRDQIAQDCRRVRAPTDNRHWIDNLNGQPMTKDPFERITSLTDAPPLLEAANEMWLIHGTDHVGAEAISTDDFDMGRARPTGLFGAGLYLAESVSKSDEYVTGKVVDGVEQFPLLICRASMGHVHYCAERRPDKRDLENRCLHQDWHSVLGDRVKTSGTFREFIVYDNLQVFPGFIVYYKRLT